MKRKIVLIILLVLFVPVFVSAKSEFFYDTFKNKVFAREYNYEHQDSFDPSLSTEKIYYWYPVEQYQIDDISNINNVIFGNFCWQMIRTTDTGGVKLLYNGVPTDGKCNSTGSASTIGNSVYATNDSVAAIGYMYNSTPVPKNVTSYGETFLSGGSLSSVNWYADDVSYNSSTGKYSLVNPIAITSRDDYSYLVGKYILSSNNTTENVTTAYYIISVDDSSYYYKALSYGDKAANIQGSFTYGDDFIDNGDGTYTITNPTTFRITDYYANKSNIVNKYVCRSASNTCSELQYIFSASWRSTSYYKPSIEYKFANSFTYSNGEYTLSNDAVPIWNFYDNSNVIRTKHYFCLNKSNKCENISFAYSLYNHSLLYYTLSDGKGINEFLDSILYADDVNRISSPVKTKVDNWYHDNLVDYTEYIDDTIYCSSRDFTSNDGFTENGRITDRMTFYTGLACKRDTDKFSVSNPKARLTYPIGLPSDAEMSDFIKNNKNRAIGVTYWTMTPVFVYSGGTAIQTISSEGSYSSTWNSNNMQYVRPAISLKANMGHVEGDGSKDNPYIAVPIKKYKVDVQIKNETKDVTIDLEDFTKVDAGEEVKFRVTPIKGYKLIGVQILDSQGNEIQYTITDNKNEYIFEMPEDDVTIIPSYKQVTASVGIEDNDHTKEFIIDVNDSSAVVYEDEVIFSVEPEEGYVVEKIEIIDEDGNHIQYHKTNNENEYSFVMPDVDVTIIPTYKRIDIDNGNGTNKNGNKTIIRNPKTGVSLAILFILLLFELSYILIIKKKKKNVDDLIS